MISPLVGQEGCYGEVGLLKRWKKKAGQTYCFFLTNTEMEEAGQKGCREWATCVLPPQSYQKMKYKFDFWGKFLLLRTHYLYRVL